MYIITNVHISRSIIYLPLISDFISNIQTLLGSSNLKRWLNHNLKGPKKMHQPSHLEPVRTLTFFTQLRKIDIISLSNIVHSKSGFA